MPAKISMQHIYKGCFFEKPLHGPPLMILHLLLSFQWSWTLNWNSKNFKTKEDFHIKVSSRFKLKINKGIIKNGNMEFIETKVRRGTVRISAARFGDLSPVGLLFEPFVDQYFALATLKFGYFLGYFSKIVIKTCLNRFLAWFSELWCRYFWILGGLWCRSFEIFKLLWCRSFGVFKNLVTFCSNFLAALVRIQLQTFGQRHHIKTTEKVFQKARYSSQNLISDFLFHTYSDHHLNSRINIMVFRWW